MLERLSIGECVDSCESRDPASEGPERDFTYVDIASIDRDEKRILNASRIRRRDAPSRARQLIRVNDVLVSTVRPNLNAVALVPEELDGATASTGFTVLRPRPDRVEASYLFHWVKTPQFVEQMVRQATGASYPAVSDRIVRGAMFPVPALAEQRRIAAILDKADALRAKRREAIAKLDQLLQSMFFEIFGDVSTNDSKWPVIPLGELVVSTKLGLVRGAAEFGESPGFDVPYIRMDAIGRSGEFLPEKVKKTCATNKELEDVSLMYGDMLFNTRNSEELVGKSAIFELRTPWTFNNNLLRLRFNDQANPFYVLRYLMSSRGQTELARRKSGTTNVFAVYYKDLRTLPVVVPPKSLQDKFQGAVEVHRYHKNLAIQQRQKFDALFKVLQQGAFSAHALERPELS